MKRKLSLSANVLRTRSVAGRDRSFRSDLLRFERLPDCPGHSWKCKTGRERHLSVVNRRPLWLCSLGCIRPCHPGDRLHFLEQDEPWRCPWVSLPCGQSCASACARFRIKSMRDSWFAQSILKIFSGKLVAQIGGYSMGLGYLVGVIGFALRKGKIIQ